MSLSDNFQNNAIDYLILSNTAIKFNGFFSNFYQLKQHGWDIRYHQDFNRDDTFFILTKGECKLVLSVNHYCLRSALDHLKNGIDLSLVGLYKENQYSINSEQDFIKCQEALLEYQAKKLKDKMTEGFLLDQKLKNVG